MLGERLRAARHSRFVGRAVEKDLFQTALQSAELPFYVLYVFGPGGVGKTTLLQEFGLICEQEQIATVYLDGRNIDPSPEAFVQALRQVIRLQPQDSLAQALAQPRRFVILLDTYETLSPLDGWLRETFLPQLPENTLVVMAGRQALNPAWRADSGWQSLTQTISLRNLERSESVDYLARRHIPSQQYQAVLNFTYGHPLALSLVADVFAQRSDIQFQPETVPDVVKTLLAQFVQKVPGPAHRAALEICALLRLTTESLLAEMMQVKDVRELFDWLHSLSFIESGHEGLFPHDLAREALVADLRWRNPDWYAELHRRARQHYVQRLQQTSGPTQQRVLFDLIFLHRDNPLVRPSFEWKTNGNFVTDVMQSSDMPALLAMVARHEGAESAKLASFWFSRQPDGVLVVRDDKRQAVGFVLLLGLQRLSNNDIAVDPSVRAAASYLQNQAPLRLGENATLFRYWMAQDTYQDVSSIQSLLFILIVRHYLTTPGLAFTFLPCSTPDFWAAAFGYADLARLPQADFTVGEKRYGVYGHDWRVVPPSAWLELLGEREIMPEAEARPPQPVEQVIVLSEQEFSTAVQAALRDYSHPDILRHNPLLRSRLVLEETHSSASEAERIAALRSLMRQAAESMQASPRQAKFYSPLFYTYIQPAPTQEQAAELLNLPFSSFRRHLKSGITRMIEIMWSKEIGTPDTAK